MSETSGISESSSSEATPITTTNDTKTGAATAPGPSGDINQQTVTSLEDLEKKSPEVHKAMLEGIAQTICRKMQKNQENIKKLMREGRN